jgi:hypothetical protein
LKRLIILIAVVLFILLILGVLVWLFLLFLGPAVIEDNQGVWHIPGPGPEVLTQNQPVETITELRGYALRP